MTRIAVPVAIALVVVSVATTAGQGRPAAIAARPSAVKTPGPQAIATARELMTVLTIPTSNTVFEAASEPPKTDEAWAVVVRDAMVLAESANLLMMPGRGPSGAEWNTLSVAQRDQALVAMKAAQKKDADALSNASDALYETCDNCHKKFMAK